MCTFVILAWCDRWSPGPTLIMASLMQKIGRLAVKTFRREPKLPAGVFSNHYDQLYTLLSNVTAKDLNLDPALLRDRGHFSASKDVAPVTYMQIYEDNDVTICIFILKRGVRLPLHDHPGMYGLLKVVHGCVSVQSYSLIDNPVNEGNQSGIFRATKHQLLSIGANDPPCRLCPGEQNVHEIYSVDGPAAFLDILSPPYGTDERLGLERDCHYYQELDSSWNAPQIPDSNFIWLVNIPTPGDFWCDQAEYHGPTVSEDDGDEHGS